VLLDDTQYDEAEQWMQACNSEYMKFSMMYNDFLNANVTENEKDDGRTIFFSDSRVTLAWIQGQP
jgi:hypothetical protein